MCGIVGCITYDSSPGDTTQVINQMASSLKHRGPDDNGTLVLKIDDHTIGLGHRRLSIIDLSPLGHQPMSFAGLSIVFNGEIYNYLEIKIELEKLNYEFSSNSDTEVILKAYHQWGIEAIDRFVGMFSFCLVDERMGLVYLVRDRAGVKPLYYFRDPSDRVILFASELRAFHSTSNFHPKLDLNSVGLYFKYGYVPAPNSIFENTHKVTPGSYVKIDLKKKSFVTLRYWDPISWFNKPKLKISYDEAKDQLEKILVSSFKYRLISDVPVGVFLSGGYDSSIVAAILQRHSDNKINTFSIGFREKEYNEANYAKQIALHLGTTHHETYCSINDAKNLVPKIPKIFDEPFGDSSAVPTTLVSNFASSHVKVVLSADGGDEIFAGYNQYFYFLELYSKFRSVPNFFRGVLANLSQSASRFDWMGSKLSYNFQSRMNKIPQMLKAKNILEFNSILNEFFTNQELRHLIAYRYSDLVNKDLLPNIDLSINDELNAMLAISYTTSLPDDMLTKVDRATMFSSIEGREPMLDHRIFEYVAQLPSDYKYKNHVGKRILKDITHKYIPKNLLDRPKMGFAIPVESWLKGDLAYLLDEHLSSEALSKSGIFNSDAVRSIVKDFRTGHRFNFAKVWYLLIFQMWYHEWISNKQLN